MSNIKVLALVGSLRAASTNRQIAELAAENAPDGMVVTVFDGLGDIPFYNEDVDGSDTPAAAVKLRDAVGDADALLVVTPEYNGSYPALVKNAIDWLSRPFGASAARGKPVAVIGGALGQYGGVWSHDDTRKGFGIAGANVIEALTLSVPFGTLNGQHPRENDELVANVNDVLTKLAAEIG
jgi:NAD(P)H-dependent FMN reductase